MEEELYEQLAHHENHPKRNPTLTDIFGVPTHQCPTPKEGESFMDTLRRRAHQERLFWEELELRHD